MRYSLGFLTLLCSLGFQTSVFAQSFGSPEIDRGLGRSVTNPHDGAPPSAVYNYQLGATFLYFNGNSRSLYYRDYLDRFDRALKFGYRIPRDPYFTKLPQAPAPGQPAVVDPADPASDPADFLPQPPPRRSFFRRY